MRCLCFLPAFSCKCSRILKYSSGLCLRWHHLDTLVILCMIWRYDMSLMPRKKYLIIWFHFVGVLRYCTSEISPQLVHHLMTSGSGSRTCKHAQPRQLPNVPPLHTVVIALYTFTISLSPIFHVDVAACRCPSQLQSAILGFVFGQYRIAVSQWKSSIVEPLIAARHVVLQEVMLSHWSVATKTLRIKV